MYNYYIVEKETKKTAGEDVNLELLLRPSRWEDYVGQEKVKANLRLIIDAAKGRGETTDHLYFTAKPDWAKQRLPILSAEK